jgi:hypothetical protein
MGVEKLNPWDSKNSLALLFPPSWRMDFVIYHFESGGIDGSKSWREKLTSILLSWSSFQLSI